MKTGIHPKYNDTIQIACACGNIIPAGSTVKEIKTELCSACHPFYTGKQKLVDTAGKVDKFMARIKKAQAFKEQQVKKVEGEDEDENETEEVEEIAETEVKVEMEKLEEETIEVEEKVAKKAAKKPAAKPAKKTSKK